MKQAWIDIQALLETIIDYQSDCPLQIVMFQ